MIDDTPDPITITTPPAGEDYLALQVYQQVPPPPPLNTNLPDGFPDPSRRRRFDACQTDCTPDCGHCKGDPVGALRTQLRKVEAAQADLERDLRGGMDLLRDVVAGDMSTAALPEVALRVAHELERRRDETPHLVWMGEAGDGFGVDIKPGRELMKALAVEMMDVLDAEAGPNYVQWDVKPAGQVLPYRLILVRPGGKSPHELRQQAEAERDTARRLLVEHADCDDDQCRAEVDAALGREGTPS